MTDRLAAARKLLDQHGQGHVLHFVDQLDDPQRLQLIDQIEGIDWPEVARLIDSHVLNKPAPCYGMTPAADQQQKYTDARALGEQLIRDGKVAAFTVAGGQGTRLGYDGPKGSFPATPIRKLPLFGIFAEFIIKTQQKYGSIVPWYVMTSPVNDQPTREAFEQNDYFGLDPANVSFFPQAMMPAINKTTGKVLLESPDSLALSPNGHGGSLKALYTSGAIDGMRMKLCVCVCVKKLERRVCHFC